MASTPSLISMLHLVVKTQIGTLTTEVISPTVSYLSVSGLYYDLFDVNLQSGITGITRSAFSGFGRSWLNITRVTSGLLAIILLTNPPIPSILVLCSSTPNSMLLFVFKTQIISSSLTVTPLRQIFLTSVMHTKTGITPLTPFMIILCSVFLAHRKLTQAPLNNSVV